MNIVLEKFGPLLRTLITGFLKKYFKMPYLVKFLMKFYKKKCVGLEITFSIHVTTFKIFSAHVRTRTYAYARFWLFFNFNLGLNFNIASEIHFKKFKAS